MATTLVSVEEYLRTQYKPGCEYLDGVLRQKPMPTRKHGRIQSRLSFLIERSFNQFEADPETTVRITPTRYLVPDFEIQRADRIQDPYPTEPVHVCVEILSPEDRTSEVFAKCEEYHAWGVETTWILDPDSKRAWIYSRGERPVEVATDGALTAEGLSIPIADVFAVLKG